METNDIDRIREYIRRCSWTWARTYIGVPHEYIARKRCRLYKTEFDEFVNTQRAKGVHEKWGRYNFPYLYVDGYKYWTMGNPVDETKIINRQKVFDEFDTLPHPLPRYYADKDLAYTVTAINQLFPNRKIYEAGCGEGLFAKASGISPSLYKGVDPSRKALEAFRENVPGLSRCVSRLSMEQAVERWQKDTYVIIALFGAASYFMRQYLQILEGSGHDFFLMFYREGFVPEAFKTMHHFEYTQLDLEEMFPHTHFYPTKDYRIVSTRTLNWNWVRAATDHATLI